MRRLLPGLVLGGALLALSHSLWGQLLVDRYSFNAMSWFDTPQLTRHLRLIMKADDLTQVPDRCIVLLLHDQDGALDVTVLQKGTKNCPPLAPDNSKNSDTQNLPETPNVRDLFHFRIDRMNREILTDAGHKDIYRTVTLPPLYPKDLKDFKTLITPST